MYGSLRKFALFFTIISLLLVSCTRNRPMIEPVDDGNAPITPVVVTSLPPAEEGGDAGGAEPQVTTATPVDAAAAETPETTPEADSGPQTIQYTVQPGDTLSSIAAKYGTTFDELVRLNFLVDQSLRVGQVLRVSLGEGYTAEGAPTPTPQTYLYPVQPGDTLFGIAQQFGVEATSIIEANGLVDQNSLVIGQDLIIPGYQPPVADSAAEGTPDATTGAEDTTTSGGQVVHVVQPGESLLLIAERYGVSAAEIAAANNIQNRELLRVGQRLFIPGITPQQAAAANSIIHTVQPGEGLLEIAVRYGVTSEAIAAANNIQNTDLIYPGQDLIIPLN